MNQREKSGKLVALGAHHELAEFPFGLGLLATALGAGFFVVLAAFEFFLHSIELHFLLEQPDRLFDIPSYLYFNHGLSSMRVATSRFRIFSQRLFQNKLKWRRFLKRNRLYSRSLR